VVLHGDLEPAFQHFWQDTKERYRLVQGDPERPVLPPEALFLGIEQFYCPRQEHAQLAMRPGCGRTWPTTPISRNSADLTVVRGADDPLARLQAHLRATSHRVLVLAESDGRREKACSTSCAPAAVTRRPSTRWPSSRPAANPSASPPPR
jgi:transcription-repair coupling factor (superfamily II helicase)